MLSIRDKILKAKSQKEIDSLFTEFGKWEYVSTNTKTKVIRAIKQREAELTDTVPKKTTKKRKAKNDKSNPRRK
jgi:predicted Fe-S protein YdhL (DUF1289 family)|tara:strand:+ start:1595 stop:1816 length:222 start_codon:yes stop_codon:yes gene_type:complete